MADRQLTFDEKRLAVICFNHVAQQWVWNICKLVLSQKGREEARKTVKQHCQWFGMGTPKPEHLRICGNAKGMRLFRKMSVADVEVAFLTWNRFVDFMEEYRCCPRSTSVIDEEELMSVFEE